MSGNKGLEITNPLGILPSMNEDIEYVIGDEKGLLSFPKPTTARVFTRGQAMWKAGLVTRTDLSYQFNVRSTVPNPDHWVEYLVDLRAGTCTCGHFLHHPDEACKHIVAVGCVWLSGQLQPGKDNDDDQQERSTDSSEENRRS